MNSSFNIKNLKLTERAKEHKLAALRSQLHVPGVMYGGNGEHLFSVSYVEMEKIMRHGCFFNSLLEVELNNEKHLVVPRHAQEHVVTDRILHLEFQKVSKDQIIKVQIPVQCVGMNKSDVIKRGGKILYALKFIKIKCKADEIPLAVQLDVSELKIGQVIKIIDLKLPANMEVVNKSNLTIIKMTGKKEK